MSKKGKYDHIAGRDVNLGKRKYKDYLLVEYERRIKLLFNKTKKHNGKK